MEGCTRSWRTLGLLILLSLLSLTGQFEVRDDEWEELGPDIAALHRLKGLSGQMFHERIQNSRKQRDTSINGTTVERSRTWVDIDQNPKSLSESLQQCVESFTTCVIQLEQDLENFLAAIDDHKIQDWFLSASEISHSYSQKLLVMIDKEKETNDRVQQEYSMDPHYSVIVSKDCLNNVSCLPEADGNTVVKLFGRVSDDGQSVSGLSGSSLAQLILKPSLEAAPVFSLDGNTTTDFHHNFVWVLMVRGNQAVLETNQENHQTYKVMNEPGSVSSRQIPKRPVDHTTQYDHQQILILQDNEIARSAATYLYEKHPAVSSVYLLDSNQRQILIKGEHVPLSENSRLTLVGHGLKDSSGEMRVAGKTATDISKIIEQTDRVGDRIKTINVVACEAGSDKTFVETLMKDLHDNANIKTELHLRDALIQVKHTGEKITQEITAEGITWRHKDESKKVVATLDGNGDVIIRQQPGSRGEAVFTDERNVLGKNDRFKKYRDNWPTEPKRFIDQNVIKEFKNSEQIRSHFDELEAMSWGLFHKDLPLPSKVNTENLQIKGEYEIGVKQGNKIRWISKEKGLKTILSKCYEIRSGEDVRSIIRHFAKSGENELTYLMINDWIVAVNPDSLYVYPIGKKLNNNQKGDDARSNIRSSIEEQIGNEKYPDIRRNILTENTGTTNPRESYAQYATEVFLGDHTTSRPPSTEAWYTTYFAASEISESARNFRTFPLTLMALDMIHSGDNNIREQGLKFLFEEHSMARGLSWIDPSSRGFSGTATTEGSSKFDNAIPAEEGNLRRSLKKVIGQEVALYESWSKRAASDVKSNMLDISDKYIFPKSDPAGRERISQDYDHFKETLNQRDTTQAYEDSSIKKTSGILGGHNDGHVTSQDLKFASQLEKSFKPESYYSRGSALSSEQINNEIKAKYGASLEGLQVHEGKARIENGQFICHLVSEVAEPVEFKVTLSPESQYYNEKMKSSIEGAVQDMENHGSASAHEGNNLAEHAGAALSAMGFTLGMKGAVRACEEADTKDCVMGALQTVQGVATMATSAIAKQALSSETRIAKAASVIMKNPAMKGAMAVLPVVGIGYSIYNFEQDLERGDTLGYIDATVDGAMLLFDVVELAAPELAPFIAPINMALSTVRMVFDDVFMGIQDELNSLPPDAGILQKLMAVTLGLEEGIFHFAIHVVSFFYDWHYDEIEQGRKYVEQISDYHKYFKVTTEEGGAHAIDFSGGGSSWNGGGIHFCLAEQGQSELCMDSFVSSDEVFGKRCWNIDTEGSNDIILGLGESHQLEHKTLQKKILMIFPAGSVTVVSGLKAIPSSRYGVYKGNSNANSFFATQKASDKHMIEVMLSYYYRLYGEPGDDIFFLGPQRSYVQGAGGKDTYIIPENGGKTIINNYDPAKAQDALHFSVGYKHISVSKSGNDVVLMYEGSHTVTIKGWFLGDSYQHMNMMSGDGVLFEISSTVISSVQLVARGINKMLMKQGEIVNASQPHLSTVTNIVGSKYDDVLIGNGEKNQIVGGGGHDLLSGGEGEDMYIIKGSSGSSVVIENYSKDTKTDLAIIEANLHTLNIRVQSPDLHLNAFHDNTAISVTLKGWFRSPEHRHLFMLTKDLITFTISDNETDCLHSNPLTKCIKSFSIDYSNSPSPLMVDLQEDEALDGVTEVRGSKFNDVIKGNKEHNVLIPGEGHDFIEGRGGEDWYVITPGRGVKNINNKSPDLALDFLYLKEDYQSISCVCDGQNIIILVHGRRDVILQNWFVSRNYQHLQIKTSDGITAGLKPNISSCGESLMLPLTVDFTKQKPQDLFPLQAQIMEFFINLQLDSMYRIHTTHNGYFRYTRQREVARFLRGLQGKVMVMSNVDSVKEMLGSSGFDIMVGNSNRNLLDPYTGGALMIGGEGKDTYIVKRGYGNRIMIDNFAQDNNTDTVRLDMDFLDGSQVTVDTAEGDPILRIRAQGEQLELRLLSYNHGFQHQHLEFQSSDGVSFKLKSLNSSGDDPLFDIEAFKVTLKTSQVDCRLDLNSRANLSTVHTVQGCPSLSNNILGNAQDNALIGGWKNDALVGGEGRDTLIGGSGDDILIGGTGDDTLYGEDGNDTMMGNSGSDVFIPGPGADLVDGGHGRDIVLYRGDHNTGQGVYVNLLTGQGRYADAEGDVLKDVETVIGTIYSDILVSGYESCLLEGSDGNDLLVSTGGDYLVGGDGNDIYMLAFQHGAVTINNCAKDNAVDVLYLSYGLTPTFDHQLLSNGVLLTFYGQNQTTVKILFEGWTNDANECGHLQLVFKDLEVSVDWLLQRCKKEASN